MIVCVVEICKMYVNIGKLRERNIIYEQVCYDYCNFLGVFVEIINNEQLCGCVVMFDGNCKYCLYDYRVYMYLIYIINLVEREFLFDEVRSKINKRFNLKFQKELFIVELEESIKEFEEEKKFIFECVSYFGVFFKENVMIVYNDFFSEYFDMLIREEEVKEKVIRDNKKIE